MNVGFKQPFAPGDSIKIEVEEKFGELKLVGDGMIPAAGTAAPAPARKDWAPSGKNTVFPVPKTHGDSAIIRQNALTNAVNLFVNRTDHTGSIEDSVDRIIEIAYKFAEFSSGQREVRLAKEAGPRVLAPQADDE